MFFYEQSNRRMIISSNLPMLLLPLLALATAFGDTIDDLFTNNQIEE
ncbi:MAG: hypothetical protein GX138_05105 [Firmicutes bacterium]|jgi:hypothetical protein|nr:hypothetical protein [Bacillota bacterium]